MSFFYSNQSHLINANPEPLDVDIQTKAIAISEIKGIYTGYIGHRSIYEAFKDQEAYNQNKFRNSENLKSNFDYKKIYNTDYNGSDRKLSLGFQDLGLIDFYKLSYKIFGINSHAPTYFYYLVFFISSLIFVTVFSKDPKKQTILLFFGLSHLIMVHFIEIVGNGLYVVGNRRFLPILSIIPTLHILITILENNFKSFRNSIAILFQTIILFLIIHFRSSAEYQILIIMSFIILLIILHRKKLYETFTFKKNISLVIISLFLISILFKSYYFLYKSPYYSLDRSGHLFWHAAYIGLSSHPQSEKKYNIFPDDSATGPIVKSKTMELYGTEDWNKIGGMKLFERLIKEEYFIILKKDPFYFLVNYSIKPIHYLINFKNTIFKLKEVFLYYILFILIIMFALIVKYRKSVMPDKKIMLILSYMALVSFIPGMVLIPTMIYTSETNILFLTISFIIISYFINVLINIYKK